jgi:hypothetical protein
MPPVLAPDVELVADVAVALSAASGVDTAIVESVEEMAALDVVPNSKDLQHLSPPPPRVPELSCCDSTPKGLCPPATPTNLHLPSLIA